MTPRSGSVPWAGLLPFYALGLCFAYTLKLFYSRAGAGELDWVLAPTCRLAGLLAGISFEREAGIGWISRDHRMIVGPACAGLNFMLIAFSALFFSFVHRLRGAPVRGAWFGATLGLAFLLTVATNSVRLVAAIRLHEAAIYGGPITPDRIHCLEGTVVYCLSLLLAYRVVTGFFKPGRAPKRGRRLAPALVPLGWYLAFTLGVPLLNRAYLRDGNRFLEHSALIVSVCLILAVSAMALERARRRRREDPQRGPENEDVQPTGLDGPFHIRIQARAPAPKAGEP